MPLTMHPENPKKSELIAYTDGGARGNPGPAAYGVVIQSPDGKVVEELAEYLGEATNNEAEYQGLLAALEYAIAHHAQSLKIFSDSELIVKQILRQYKVKEPRLKLLFERAVEMIARIPSFRITHVRREQNREADRLVNRAIDAHFSTQRH